ncbi:MAG: GTPase RsgA, partial [Ruminococcus sp.]|nr:GTPase RsgA [Ruminococcus sp.]
MGESAKSGIITKCLGGLYTVETLDGIFECKARGIFRNRGISPYVGDNVEIKNGVISEILDRKNCIIRPPLANLDQLIFIVSTCSPSPNYLILDKFITIAEYKGITPVVVITKTDLGDGSEIKEIYRNIG